jgi:hypothetical protein
MTRRPEQLGIRITDIFIPYYDAMKEEAKLKGCSVSDVARMIIQDAYSLEPEGLVLKESVTPYITTGNHEINNIKETLLKSPEFKRILREEIKNALKEILEGE